MYKSKAELRRKQMVAVELNGVRVIGCIPDLALMGLIPEKQHFEPGEIYTNSWINVVNTSEESDFILYATSFEELIEVCKQIGELESFVSGPLNNRVVSLEILRRNIDKVSAK